MQRRLGELDFPDRIDRILPVWAAQLLAALVCTALAFGARSVVDIWLPGAGPFALIFPSVLLATLFARWQAGALTMLFCALYAWYFVLPIPQSFAFADPADGPRVVVNVVSGFMIVALAELFRRAVRRAVAEREAEVAQRDLYLQEFDHRVKNNFTIMTALLEMQRRQLPDGPASDALAEASSRVGSIARAHRALYRGDGQPQRVEMRQYLSELCLALQEGLLDGRDIRLHCRSDSLWLERDRAVSIGLLANELVTNAAKHAFAGRDEGTIAVELARSEAGLELVIADDGIGFAPDAVPRPDSLGQKLIAAFVDQAGGTIVRETAAPGTRFRISLELDEPAAIAASSAPAPTANAALLNR